jgi:hypothetical protein
MIGLLEKNGETSHKRLLNISAGICAVILTLGLPALVVIKSCGDIGTNQVALILGMWGLAIGGGVASNIVEKK